jgi:hypothetical protein
MKLTQVNINPISGRATARFASEILEITDVLLMPSDYARGQTLKQTALEINRGLFQGLVQK